MLIQYDDQQKTAGPIPCRIRGRIWPLLRAVDCFPEFGAGGKLRDFPGGDLDGGARLRIASVTGFSLRDREGAETD